MEITKQDFKSAVEKAQNKWDELGSSVSNDSKEVGMMSTLMMLQNLCFAGLIEKELFGEEC